MDLAHVACLWEENQECLKQRLGLSRSQRFGARWVLMPEAPYPKFNHASCIRVDEADVDALIAEAREFFRDQGVPICSLLVSPGTRPASLADRLYRLGFTSETNPVMLWNGTPVPEVSPFVRVDVAPAGQQQVVFELIRRVFFPHANWATMQTGQRGVRISYELGALNYVAYWGTRPAGAGMLFVHEGMGGIYNMCTLPEFRGRGIATAILAAILRDAPGLGCQYVGLTPTSMGRPLYERLGFREIYQERYFVERLSNLYDA